MYIPGYSSHSLRVGVVQPDYPKLTPPFTGFENVIKTPPPPPAHLICTLCEPTPIYPNFRALELPYQIPEHDGNPLRTCLERVNLLHICLLPVSVPGDPSFIIANAVVAAFWDVPLLGDIVTKQKKSSLRQIAPSAVRIPISDFCPSR